MFLRTTDSVVISRIALYEYEYEKWSHSYYTYIKIHIIFTRFRIIQFGRVSIPLRPRIQYDLIWPGRISDPWTIARTCFIGKHENVFAIFVKCFIRLVFLTFQTFPIFTRRINVLELGYLVTFKLGELRLLFILPFWSSPICFYQRVTFWFYVLSFVLM